MTPGLLVEDLTTYRKFEGSNPAAHGTIDKGHSYRVHTLHNQIIPPPLEKVIKQSTTRLVIIDKLQLTGKNLG